MSEAIVYKRDGKYLLLNTQSTHTGTKVKEEWVEDLQKATPFYCALSNRSVNLTGAIKVRVEVMRTIALVAEDK